jgi:hypothetical protein
MLSRNTSQTAVWRFSLQDLHSNQRHGFATLQALLVSLEAELAPKQVD